jgi:protease II
MRDELKIERVALSLKGKGEEFSGGSGGGAGELGRGAAAGSAGGVRTQAPLAVREPVEHVIHGDRRVDHYAWMKNKKDPRVREYLEAENAYADAEMKATEGFQEKLYQEMLGRILQTDLSVPYSLRGYLYYTRTVEGKQYGIYCRRGEGPEFKVQEFKERENQEWNPQGLKPIESPASMSDLKVRPPKEEEVVLDLNAMAVGHTFMGLGIFEVSDDNRWLAYATDTTGFRQYVLEVKDLRNGRVLAFRVERVTSAAWAADSRTLFYVTEDEVTKRSNQLWRHVFGEEVGGQFAVDSLQSAVSEKRTPRAQPLRDSGQAGMAMPQEAGEERLEGELGIGDLADMGRPPVADAAPLRGEERPASEGGPYGSGLAGLERGAYTRGADELIYEERDERFRMDVERSRSGAYLFLVCNSHTTSEVRYLRADSPMGGFQLVAEREDEHEYYLDHHPGSASDPAGGIFFIRTNSGGRTYRLVTAPVGEPGRGRWHEVIANRPGVMLAGLEVFRTHLVLMEREDGLPHLRMVDLTREAPSAMEASRRIEFAEPAYNAMMGTNPEFDIGMVRFQYESMVTPRSVYDYDVRTGERILKKQQPVLGDFDSRNYVSERLHATAKDGTRIPISVVRRKARASGEWRAKSGEEESPQRAQSTRRTEDPPIAEGEPAPLLLYGYGSYGLSMAAMFSSNRLSLLDRGMVYAIAHIRGGGELGKPWHDAGRMHQKMNTFTDFIACAEYLVAKGYTSAEQLVIEGGSAGGLLMGAVVNLRPELFHAVVSHVPFVDVLNTMLDASLPLTVGEYEEWGNPEVEEDYFYMKRYCPYTNVERKNYPRMLVKTAWNDSQVMYWEAAKYVAKLRAMKTDENVLLLKTNMGAGHGGASGRYDFLREVALDYGFVLGEAGIGG